MHKHSKRKKHFSTCVWLVVVLLLLSIAIIFPLKAYSGSFQKSVALEKSQDIKPDGAIVIGFSMPVSTSSIENGFSISPNQQVSFKWENENKKLTISPKKYWKPQTTYVVSIKNGRNILFQKIEKNLEFKTQDYPKLVSIFPKNGEKNVAVSMENPVTANFDRPLDGFNVKFVVSPEESLEYQMNGSKTQVKLLAKDDFKWQTDYEIETLIKSKQQPAEEYSKVGQTNFQTEPEPLPAVWAKDFPTRVEQAKEFTKPQIKAGKYIDINLSEQVMVIFEDGKPLDSYLVSSGKRGMDTPVGMFKIENKATRAWSKKYGLWMPNWMAFLPSGEMGIHELPVWPGGYQEGANHLGTPVSHGCVRLGPAAAKRVYAWAEIGTPVIIHK